MVKLRTIGRWRIYLRVEEWQAWIRGCRRPESRRPESYHLNLESTKKWNSWISNLKSQILNQQSSISKFWKLVSSIIVIESWISKLKSIAFDVVARSVSRKTNLKMTQICRGTLKLLLGSRFYRNLQRLGLVNRNKYFRSMFNPFIGTLCHWQIVCLSPKPTQYSKVYDTIIVTIAVLSQ